MSENILARLIEHNNWANRQVVRACAALGDDQLDARPQSPKHWSIRENLVHLVTWQWEYLSLLTQKPAPKGQTDPSFAELEESADSSGKELLALARAEDGTPFEGQVRTSDGYRVERWVVMVQVVNHATEHRKQIAHLMRALELEPPWQDGWAFGEATGALVQITK